MATPEELTITAEVSPPLSVPKRSKRLPRVSEAQFTRIARISVATVATLVLLLMLVRLWFIDGVFRTIRIEGPSMAPTLLGAHYHLTCDDCLFEFRVDADGAARAPRIVCPNCGYREVKLEEAERLAGDVVVMDRWPLLIGSLRRGDVIGLSQPGMPELAVKRLAALPGETWSVVDGDLVVQGSRVSTLLRHDLTSRLSTVYDHNHPSRHISNVDRWLRPTENHWKITPGKLVFDDQNQTSARDNGSPKPADRLPVQWLAYQQWTTWESPAPRTTLSEVLDNDSYNPDSSRLMTRLRDLFFEAHLTGSGAGTFAVKLRDESKTFHVAISPDTQLLQLFDGTKLVYEKKLATNLERGGMLLAGLIDRRVLVAWNGRPIIEHPYRDPIAVRGKIMDPVAIGASNVSLTLTEVRIRRDNVIVPPATFADNDSEVRLGADEIAVLGDNSAVSVDSRSWPLGSAKTSSVRGLVYRPFWIAPRSAP